MVTLNFYKLCQSRLGGAYSMEMICSDGGKRVLNTWATPFSRAMINFTDSLTTGGVCLLGEYNEPGLEKYTVTGMLNSAAVGVYPPSAIQWGVNNDCVEGTVTLGLQGLEDGVTIKGLALFCNGTSGDGAYFNALMDITPLDSPITINKSETKQITYTIRLNSGA